MVGGACMKLEKYPKYKDSGVEWLGEIPEGWEVLPTKRFHKNKKEINIQRVCDNVLSLTLHGVVNNDIDNPKGLVPKDYATYQIFEKNDLVFKLIDLENISTSRVGLVHEKGIMSSAYIRLEIGNSSFVKYAYYYFYNLYLNNVYNNLGSGVRSTLGPTDLLNIPYLEPPKQEQTKITNYLDQKTAQIDKAISLKEQLIERLKEYRQILINDAVTKGLDKNVKMKDSGIEWIGEIPEHWEVKKLKYIFKEINDRSKTGEEELLSLSKYQGVIPKSSLEERAGMAKTLVGYKKVYQNNLVINKMQAVNGLLAVSKIEGITSPDYSVYRTISDKYNIDYYGSLLNQSMYLSEFKKVVTGVMEGFIRLYTDDLYNISVQVPPKEEQKKIVEYIEEQTKKIDHIVTLQQKQIKKLKEYKATLIDSVVTGKVRIA